MFDLRNVLEIRFGNDVLQTYLIALVLFFGLLLIFKIFKTVVVGNLKKLAKKTNNNLDDVLVDSIENISWFFYLVIAVYYPLKMVSANPIVEKVAYGIFVVVIIYQVIVFIQRFIEYAMVAFSSKQEGKQAETTFHGVKLIVKIILWSVGGLLVLSNLGFDITSLVASLGIGGIAVALAVQNILSDIFSSFSIYFDKPFAPGDYIVVGPDRGIVKKIGLKTTRLTTLHGEELIISNRELTSTRVQNFKRMKRRRIEMFVKLVYGTSNAKMKKASEIIRKAIDKTPDTTFLRCRFIEFGDSSLNFEVVYFVESGDYDVYVEKHEVINYAIKDAFEKEKIHFAYPTQTLYLTK